MSVPRASAISPTERPTQGESGSDTSMRAKSESTPMDRRAAFSAPARSPILVSGSAMARRRPSGPSWVTSRQPGSPGSSVEARIRIMSGRVSATTWAPTAAARSEASSCCW